MALVQRTAFTRWRTELFESWSLALDSVRTQPTRSTLAIIGIVIGIVTVVIVASVLAGLRNSVADLFRESGHRQRVRLPPDGRPYSPPSEREARREPLEPVFARELARRGDAIRDVALQVDRALGRQRPRLDRRASAAPSRTRCSSRARPPTSSTSSGASSPLGVPSPSSRTARARGWP